MNAVLGRILLATDGSEDATLAARAAVDIASKVGSELHVVHVWVAVPSARFGSFIRTQLEQEAQGLLDEQVEEIERAGGAVARAHLREGRSADEISGLAEEVGAYHVAFLVAAAAALVGFFVSLLLGDTAQATGQEEGPQFNGRF